MPPFSSTLPDSTEEDRLERLEQLPIRISAGNAAVGQTILTFASVGGISMTGAPVTNVYTATAGKTFFITDICITTNETALPQLVQLKQGGVVIFETFIMSTLPCDFPGIESQPSVGGGNRLEIWWSANTGKLGTFFISGFEQ
jgi:hypothetical protein